MLINYYDASQIDIQKGNIFQQSKCLEHENSLFRFLQSQLFMLGYECKDPRKRIWSRQDKTVIVCLVDDIQNLYYDIKSKENVVVITDNIVQSYSDLDIIRLPESFYGIYYHKVDLLNQKKYDKLLSFCVNRLDLIRYSIFVELIKKIDKRLDNAYINFNAVYIPQCFPNKNFSEILEGINSEFLNFLGDNSANYQTHCDFGRQLLPYKSYGMSFEDARFLTFDDVQFLASLNMIVETYSWSGNISISEKTFRGLVIPRPFTLFAGQNTVDYLRSLGFKVYDDFVNHRLYDNQDNTNDNFYNRFSTYVDVSLQSANEVLMNRSLIEHFNKISMHNQRLLAQFRDQWTEDFCRWWPTVAKKLK